MAKASKNMSAERNGVKIANPIYDTVFKYLMENRRVARFFIDEKEIVETYEHDADNEVIKEMLDILRNVAADPEERKAIEAEWFAVKDEEGYEQALSKIAEQGNTITKHVNTIAAKDKDLAAKDKEIAELRRQLGLNNT